MSKRADRLNSKHWRRATDKTVYSTSARSGSISRAELKEEIDRQFSDYRIKMRQERVEAEEARKKEEQKQKRLDKLGHIAAGLPAYAASAAVIEGVRIPGTTRTTADVANFVGRTAYNFAKSGTSGADVAGSALALRSTKRILAKEQIPGLDSSTVKKYQESMKQGGIIKQLGTIQQKHVTRYTKEPPGVRNPATTAGTKIFDAIRNIYHGKKEGEAMATPQYERNYDEVINGVAGAESRIREADLKINQILENYELKGKITSSETKQLNTLMDERTKAQGIVNESHNLPAQEVAAGGKAYTQQIEKGKQYEQADYSSLAGAGAEVGLILYAGAKLAKITRPIVKATYKIGRGIAQTVGAASKGLERIIAHSKGKGKSIDKTADLIIILSFVIFAAISSFRITGFVINDNSPQPAQLFSLIFLGIALTVFLTSKIYKHIITNKKEVRK